VATQGIGGAAVGGVAAQGGARSCGRCRRRCSSRTRRAGRRRATSSPSRSAIGCERSQVPPTLCPVAARGAGPPRRGAGTIRGPTVLWSQDHPWSLPQDKGLGPPWSHRPDFPCETRDHAGTTGLVLAPRLVPHKRPVWSHKTRVWSQGGTTKMCPVVPGVAACGTMTARHVASGGGLSPRPLAPPWATVGRASGAGRRAGRRR